MCRTKWLLSTILCGEQIILSQDLSNPIWDWLSERNCALHQLLNEILLVGFRICFCFFKGFQKTKYACSNLCTYYVYGMEILLLVFAIKHILRYLFNPMYGLPISDGSLVWRVRDTQRVNTFYTESRNFTPSYGFIGEPSFYYLITCVNRLWTAPWQDVSNKLVIRIIASNYPTRWLKP